MGKKNRAKKHSDRQALRRSVQSYISMRELQEKGSDDILYGGARTGAMTAAESRGLQK